RSRISGNPRNRQHQEYLYKVRRLQEKQVAFCQAVANYRDVWYQQLQDTPASYQQAVQFQHPPLPIVSWQKVVESEEIYKELCTLNHELIVISASLASDPPSVSYLNNKEFESPDDLHAATEDLMCSLLPFWEEIRKDRALIVNHCRPEETSDNQDSGGSGWMGWLQSAFGVGSTLENIPHKESKQFVDDESTDLQRSASAISREWQGILEQRANKIQSIIDQNPSPDHLTDKIIRVLVRSYVDIGTLEAAHQAERVYNGFPEHQKNLLWYVLNGYVNVVNNQLEKYHVSGKRKSAVDESEKTISKTAALATKRICELASAKHSTDPSEFQSCALIAFQALASIAPFSEALSGYHDRVHSLGILKFGPWQWEAITKTKSTKPKASISDNHFHPKDHKTLSLLVSIYGQDEEYLDRALNVLNLMFDSFSTDELRDSLRRETFHVLMKSLIRRQELRMKTETSQEKAEGNPELDLAFQLVDRMMTESVWIPNSDTFYNLFRLTAHSGPDAERVRTKLEACAFMNSGNEIADGEGSQSSSFPHPLYPSKAAKFALNAWVETAKANDGDAIPGQPDPAERAWDIIRSLQIASTPLFLPAEAVRDIYDLGSAPDASTYILALQVCSRVKSKNSLAVALKILDAVEKEDNLMTRCCATLVTAVNTTSDIEQRIQATKRIYELATKNDPILKQSLRKVFSKQIGYFRNVHHSLFQEHFGDMDLSQLDFDEVEASSNVEKQVGIKVGHSLMPSLSSSPPDHTKRGLHTHCFSVDIPHSSLTADYNTMAIRNFASSLLKDNFVVSILGPPNAGKSTLFNRLQCKESNKTYQLGSSKRNKRRKSGRSKDDAIRGRISSRRTSRGGAIVSPVAGTTRDRKECVGRIGGTEFRLIDTAGVDGDRIQTWNDNVRSSKTVSKSEERALEQAMMEQTMRAAQQSDLVFLLWDARVGVTHDLLETARWLRKLGKHTNVVVLANKLEGDSWAQDEDSPVMEHLNEVLQLGLGEAIPISALQGEGMADIAAMIEQLKSQKLSHLGFTDATEDDFYDENKPQDAKPLQIAIIGRQNVGKSTLVNTLLKDQRVLTGPTPGLTRDAIAAEWITEDGQEVQLVDTAGIQKLTKRMDDAIEDMSVADALRAMKVAEVAVLVLDADAMYIQRLELALCNAVVEEGRALVVAVNKIDLLDFDEEYTPEQFLEAVREQLETRIPMLRNTPIVPMSCITGEGITDLLPTLTDARDRWARTFPTGVLNRWLREVIDSAPLPVVSGVRAKLKYIIQTKGRPPTFIIFANVDELPDTYLR
ncbi:MAG: hypothetical protein SGILL_006696, partial [Bacillariaceae sp.]